MTTALDQFRTEVRGWIAANFPPMLAGLPALYNPAEATERHESNEWKIWLGKVAEKGWGAPGWDPRYGGAGLDPEQISILQEELSRVGATNPIVGLGNMMLGPVLLDVGTEALKLQHLPPIARGEVRWCQGFSEPGAGSDLASLQTRCEDLGDRWLVNGQKIWTSFANIADWCFCLVRTDGERKQDGITFLLIDMRSSGVEARPIKLINGVSHFCELFLNDVEVPKAQTLGPINGGWPIAKRLMEHERTGLSANRRATLDVVALARKKVGLDAAGRLSDPDLRQRLIDHAISENAYESVMHRAAGLDDNREPFPIPVSVLKNIGMRTAQNRYDLAVEILGHGALAWSDAGSETHRQEIVGEWLFSRAFSIYGGSHEIQNNITAKRVLELPA